MRHGPLFVTALRMAFAVAALLPVIAVGQGGLALPAFTAKGWIALIFLGATAPEASWPVWSVLVLGTVTGGVAGGLLGVVSGWFLPSLTGAAGGNRTGRYRRSA